MANYTYFIYLIHELKLWHQGIRSQSDCTYFKCCCCNLHNSAEHLPGSPYSRLFTTASWVLMLMSNHFLVKIEQNTCLNFWSFQTSEVLSLIFISPESMALRHWHFFFITIFLPLEWLWWNYQAHTCLVVPRGWILITSLYDLSAIAIIRSFIFTCVISFIAF